MPAGHGHRGRLFVPPDEVAEAVRLLSQEGFQVHFHALGDRAVHVALDALARARAERARAVWPSGPAGPPGRSADLRHHLAHLQFIRPGDLDRFRELGAVANFQPLWACHDPQMDDLTLPVVGPERARWQYRIGTLAQRGTRIAFGSDWPVSSADPLQEIHVAVNRRLSAAARPAGHGRNRTGRSCPMRPSLSPGPHRVHRRRRVRQPPRDGPRLAAARPPGRHRGARP